MEIVKVAWRNVFRNRRRSILNIIALVISITLMIVGYGWVAGYDKYVFGSIINFQTGHIHVLKPQYLEEERRLPLDINIENYEKMRARLLEMDGVKEVSGRINYSLSLSNGVDSIRLLGRAIDPIYEKDVTKIQSYIQKGNYLRGENQILIGLPLAEKMNLEVGDTVFLTAVDKYSVSNFTDFRVAGLFEFGYPAMDENIIFTDLVSSQEFLSMEGSVNKLVLRLEEDRTVDSMVAFINERLNQQDLEAYSWKTFAQTAVTAVRGDTTTFWFVLAILYLLIILGILNSMSMSIYERTGELGTLRAIGMRRSVLVRLIFFESICLALIAGVLGIIVSLPFAAFLQFVGIDIQSSIPAEIPVPFGETFYADFHFSHFLIGFLVGIVSALLGSILPSIRASKLSIADSMGSAKIR